MIGYNIAEINSLILKLNNSYEKLGETMANGWSDVSSTLETEWVGPDELSFEEELAKRICDLYYACKESLNGMVTNIHNIGESWKEFQKSNVLSGATAGTALVGAAEAIEHANLKDYDISSVVKRGEPTFTESTKFGVTNGEASATNINKKVTDYVTNVHDTVKTMYEDISSSTAFLGADQSTKIDAYLTAISTQVAKLTTCVDDMRTNLTELVKAYTTQAEAFNNQVQQATDSSNIQMENSIL